MDWKAHLTYGSIVGIIFFLCTWKFIGWFDLSLVTIITSILIIAIYSLLADCDHPISTITYTFFGFSIIVLLFGVFLKNDFYIYFGLAFLIFTFICAKFFKHRGPIHSLLAGAIFCLPLYFIGNEFALLAFISFWSHLWLDKIPFKFV